jgi:hypothetical protein
MIWQRTPKNIISPLCFHRFRMERGKDKRSLGAFIKVQKPEEVLI